MKLSEKGRALLIKLEGKRNHVYEDVAGLKTIGVGHLLKPGETFTELTDDEVDALLIKDVEEYEMAVNKIVTVALTQCQFDALVIFAFNVGIGAFSRSTLLKNINDYEKYRVPDQLMRWNRVGGKVVEGLTNRRKAEVDMWNGVA